MVSTDCLEKLQFNRDKSIFPLELGGYIHEILLYFISNQILLETREKLFFVPLTSNRDK